MEETFLPLGSDHRIILDERVERFPFARLPFFLGTLFVLLLLAIGGGWIWQRRVPFSVPETAITATLPPAGQRWLQTQATFPIPTVWTEAVPGSRYTILIGGTLERPTWVLAPVWVKAPPGFVSRERHGFYRLSALGEAGATTSLRLSETKSWLKQAPDALGALTWRQASSSEPVFLAWNPTLLTSSLPASVQGTLSETDDASYLLQHNDFDTALLASASVNGQGLAPWRDHLERVSWSDTVAGRSWELRFEKAIPQNNLFLPPSGTERRFLQDDSTSNLLTATSSIPTDTTLRLGETPSSTGRTCSTPDFHAFLRLRGETLARLLPLLLPSAGINLLEVGAFQERLSICLE